MKLTKIAAISLLAGLSVCAHARANEEAAWESSQQERLIKIFFSTPVSRTVRHIADCDKASPEREGGKPLDDAQPAWEVQRETALFCRAADCAA